MAIIWKIETLNRQTSDGFVTAANWRATATDGDYSATAYNICSWSEGTPTIPYANLTQDEVLGWVWEIVNKFETETALQAQIDLQKNPVTAIGVPWE